MNNSTITFLTTDECLLICDKTACNVMEDPLFVISLLVNAGLLITTSSSELMATSKCKFNSLWELLTFPLQKIFYRKKKEQQPNDIESQIEIQDIQV